MKLSWKLFFIITTAVLLAFSIYGTWMNYDYFKNNLNQEIEDCNQSNRLLERSLGMLQSSVTAVYGSRVSIGRIVSSIYEPYKSGESSVRIYDENGEIIYEDHHLKITHHIDDKISEKKNLGYEVLQKSEAYYLVSLLRAEDGKKYEITRDITFIYNERNRMMLRYQSGVLLVTLLLGAAIYAIIYFSTQNIRSLTLMTKRFAQGDYKARVKAKGRDELYELSGDFNKMADMIEKQMESLKEEVLRQERFSAAFAHELRTPLTSIVGYADMLRMAQLEADEVEMCGNYIFSQGKRLQSLSGKLMEMIMADKGSLEKEEISSEKLLFTIAQMEKRRLEEAGLELIMDVKEGIIHGDLELLISLFINLMDNAVKASDFGKRIWVSGRIPAEDKWEYEISVTDEGRGMKEEELKRVTEAFYMGDKSRSRKEGGAGMGMTLCEKIVILHGANWSIESQSDKGTMVTVRFREESV